MKSLIPSPISGNINSTLLRRARSKQWGAILAVAALIGGAANPAHAVLVIDNFAASVGHTQTLSDNTDNATAVEASFAATGNAVILGGQRDVSINLLSSGGLPNAYTSTNLTFSNAGARIEVPRYNGAAQVEFGYSNLNFDAAASGSYIALTQVMNHMPSGYSSAINTLAKSIEVGQRTTLTLIDTDGRTASLEKPINYWGSSGNPRVEDGRFDVVFDFSDLLANNGLLNFSLIDSISLRFDLLNTSGFSEILTLGDGASSALVLGGDAFSSASDPSAVPDQSSWMSLPACLTVLAFVGRRFKRA